MSTAWGACGILTRSIPWVVPSLAGRWALLLGGASCAEKMRMLVPVLELIRSRNFRKLSRRSLMPIASFEDVVSILPIQPWRPSIIWECLEDPANAVGDLVCQALLKEVELTPKPGLVDRHNSGSHRDMDLATFYASIEAIAPWFPLFSRIGASSRECSP